MAKDPKPKPEPFDPKKPLTPEQADRLLKALKRDPKGKNEPGKNPPKKGWSW